MHVEWMLDVLDVHENNANRQMRATRISEGRGNEKEEERKEQEEMPCWYEK